MELNSQIIKKLHSLAVETAKAAGEYIAQHRPQDVNHKSAGSSVASQVVTEVDRASQSMILARLANSRMHYDLGLLAEEDEDDGSRLEKDFFWCIDPLDGTLPFIEDRDGYAVAIALINKAGIPHIGVVYNPRTKACYSAVKGGGVFCNGEVFLLKSSNEEKKDLNLFHHRSLIKNPNFNQIIADIKTEISAANYADCHLTSHGGAIMNAIWCLLKSPAYYFALPKKTQGGGCIWDYAATVCIFNELDLEVSDYYGRPLCLNRPETIYMNDLGIRFSTL